MQKYSCPRCKQNYGKEDGLRVHLMDFHAYTKEQAEAETTQQKYRR